MNDQALVKFIEELIKMIQNEREHTSEKEHAKDTLDKYELLFKVMKQKRKEKTNG